MNARLCDFIQMTRRAIGLHFKFGRQQARLTSSLGHSGSHSREETLITYPVQPPPSEPSAGNSEPILEDKRPVEIEPSAKEPSESLQSFEDARENPQDGVRFKDSPSRIIVHNEGSAAYHALLLGEDLVSKQRETLHYCRQRSYLNRRITAIERKIIMIEDSLYFAKESTEKTSSNKRSTTVEDWEQKLLSANQKRDVLNRNLKILNNNIEFVREETEEIVEEALREANMLNLSELDDDSTTSIQDPTAHDQTSAAISVRSSSTGISMEHTFRLAVVQEMETWKRLFHIMQDAFNEQNVDYRKIHEEYEEAVQNGTCDLSQSDFDRMALKTLQRRTGDYIDAGIAYEEVKCRARALGLLDNEFEQESNFVDHPDDGYRESHEAVMKATINEEGIERWKAQIIISQDMEIPNEELEADEWEAKSVGISDSVSLVDYTRNGDRINRWREFCELVREEDAELLPDCLKPSLISDP